MEKGIASTVIGKLGTIQIERTESRADCFDPKRTKRGPRRWERPVQDSPMIVKSGKGVRKLNKSIKDIKGTQRDEKIRNDTKGDVTKRECTERSRY